MPVEEQKMSVKLMNGDCLERMKEIPDASVDMVLCDPPYGIDFQSCRIKDKDRRKPKIRNDKARSWSSSRC